MSEPFLAEVRVFGFQFAPRGWAACDGQILPIDQNQALFSLLGTTYGGDGSTSFALPDLRGRTPLHAGTGYNLSQKAGEESHFLDEAEMPVHDHALHGTSEPGSEANPNGRMFADATHQAFGRPQDTLTLDTAVASIGANQGHENRQPLLALNFCIALEGIFPSRN